jgi:hypothetical protein
LIFATSRRLRASPKTYSTRFSSHQLISSRQKPESALSTMPTLGQRARICLTMLDLLARAMRGIDVGAPELGGEQMAAAEDVEMR